MIEWIALGAAAMLGSMFGSDTKSSSSSGGWSPSRFNEDQWRRKQEAEEAAWRAKWEQEVDRSRWIPQSVAHRIIEAYPHPRLGGDAFHNSIIKSVRLRELLAEFAAHNVEHLAAQKAKLKSFFDTIEASPLTNEQADACICMDDAVQIVAAAGSGKTSTMVAKAGYVLHEKLAEPGQILLLAFNKKAAAELRHRILDRLRNCDGFENVTVSTFHAFGKGVLAKALHASPSIAPWIDSDAPGKEIETIASIVEDLRAADSAFGVEWDLFRTVYGRAINRPEDMMHTHDDELGGIRTANGDWVKSQEERLIADWLFFHNVRYKYEQDYEHVTKTRTHQQYRPDFYYPDAKLYHEHFALNQQGKAPPHFTGDYVAGVHWKRQCHVEHETELFETTSHSLRNGSGLQELAEALKKRGVEPVFDGSRPAKGQPPISTQELARLIRAFQQHVKGGALSTKNIATALQSGESSDAHVARSLKFLAIYDRIAAEWERRLREADCIDFDDMLIQAAQMIEDGKYQSSYTMIFADEFQDSSRARIRLLRALLDQTRQRGHLCVVGDDWQSINRFAGADLSVMTEFAKTFPHSSQLKLATTFRCPQSLCDASSKFVSANPRQLQKIVQTTNPREGTSIAAFAFDSSKAATRGVGEHLERLHAQALSGAIDQAQGRRLSVLLLGRYKHERPKDLENWRRRFCSQLDIEYRTIHAAKGLEADYVMILNMIEDAYGFPGQHSDDPILRLAMPESEDFPMAEERRVFYVALTRAKRQVRIYTKTSAPSRFLVEMSKNGMLDIRLAGGGKLTACPQCSGGILTARSGRHGPFEGCNFCDFTRDLPSNHRIEAGERISLRTPMAPGTICPTCGKGIMRERPARFKPFVGCSRHPECQTTAPLQA